MKTPDQASPEELLETAKCVVIIPGEDKPLSYLALLRKGTGDLPQSPLAGVHRCF